MEYIIVYTCNYVNTLLTGGDPTELVDNDDGSGDNNDDLNGGDDGNCCGDRSPEDSAGLHLQIVKTSLSRKNYTSQLSLKKATICLIQDMKNG